MTERTFNLVVPLSDVRGMLKKASGDKPKTVTIQNPRDGKLIQAVAVADLKAVGVKVKEQIKSTTRSTEDWQAKQKQRQEAAAVEANLRLAIFGQIRAALNTTARDVFELRLVASTLLDRLDYGHEAALLKDYKAKSVDMLSPDDLGRLIVECCVIEQSRAETYNYEDDPTELHALAAHHGIDVKAIRAGGTTASSDAPATLSTAARGAKKAATEPGKTPSTAGAAGDAAAVVDDKTLPLALEGGSMHRELVPQAAWPFPRKKQKDEAPSAQGQSDDAASPLSEVAS